MKPYHFQYFSCEGNERSSVHRNRRAANEVDGMGWKVWDETAF